MVFSLLAIEKVTHVYLCVECDGDSDANSSPTVVVLSGRFRSSTTYFSEDVLPSVVVRDLDGDEYLTVVISSSSAASA